MQKRESLVLFRNTLTVLSILCLFVSALFLISFVLNTGRSEEKIEAPSESFHKVLFISSYNPLYFTFDYQKRGLEKTLYSNGIDYDVVFMDSNQRGIADFTLFSKFIQFRMENKRYEAVLLGDDAALRFAMEYQKELFSKVPMVFFGINDLKLAETAAQNPYITGFYETDYHEETINLAMKLYPKRKTLVALHDNSVAGEADINIFWNLRDKYKDYAFVDLNTSLLSQNDLIYLLESLPDDSILFYMTCYSDKSGNVYSLRSRTGTLAKYVKVPIFRNYVGGEELGVLGGVHMDFEEHCAMAGELVSKIVFGTDISSFPLIAQTPSRTSFDYTLLKDNKLDFSLLPDDVVFYNKPKTFLELYGRILPPILMLFLTLLLFIFSSKISRRIAVILITDLQKSKNDLLEQEKLLRYRAENDEVLDIYNRRTLTEWLRNNMSNHDVYSVIIVDIDNFKMLNDNYGHSLADSILQYLVALIREMALEGNWQIARFGGDEFLIVIPDEQVTRDCETIKKLFEAIRAPIPLGDETLAITATMGASCSDGITSPDQHVINAEGAMYEAKLHGKNGIIIYDDEMKKKAQDEIIIKEKLQKAFDNDGFYMLYQPQIDSQTKHVSGYEALVRMKEPGIYPGQFIPIAERSGWIWRIGRITTELVIKQLAAWRDEGKTLHPVSVNFSSNQLNDHGYVDFVADLLKKYNIPSQYLEIEITEGLFLEKTALADNIFKRFKDLGIRLLMDDFGTGYSSLGYLTYIPVDIIKLDKSLVDTYLVDGKDSFIRNIIHLIHDLDKDMIIEGVEEEWQFNRLREFGADTIQGYFFSKPISADEAIEFKVK